MYAHWDWGSIMYVVAALSGLVATLILFGFHLTQEPLEMDRQPDVAELPLKSYEDEAPVYMKKAA